MATLGNQPQQTINLLPRDGTVHYYGCVLDTATADACLASLLDTIAWQPDQARFFGKLITTKRKVAWYADAAFEYRYSNATKLALPWTKQLANLKGLLEVTTGETFNSCLLNLYHSGEEGMGWHSDAEKDLMQHGAIGSLSLGAARKFCFQHKQTRQTVSLVLEHGSLLVMKDTTQAYWRHRLPPTKLVREPRVNLTFRTMVR